MYRIALHCYIDSFLPDDVVCISRYFPQFIIVAITERNCVDGERWGAEQSHCGCCGCILCQTETDAAASLACARLAERRDKFDEWSQNCALLSLGRTRLNVSITVSSGDALPSNGRVRSETFPDRPEQSVSVFSFGR